MNDTRTFADAALAANAGAGTGAMLFGWPINDVYSAIGIIVLVVQFSYWLYQRLKKKE